MTMAMTMTNGHDHDPTTTMAMIMPRLLAMTICACLLGGIIDVNAKTQYLEKAESIWASTAN